MRKKKKCSRCWQNALLLPAVFVIIVSGAVIWGMYRMQLVSGSENSAALKPAAVSGSGSTLAPLPTAPTAEQYRERAVTVIKPFMDRAEAYLPDKRVTVDQDLADLAAKTQMSLLELTVPAGERPAHLALVLLLDQWNRAATGSRLDSRQAAASTAKIIADYPWMK